MPRENKKITLTQKDTIAMFRNAFYTAMAVKNGEPKPSDNAMLVWLAGREHEIRRSEFLRIMADPALVLFGRPAHEIRTALQLMETSNTAAAYKRGFAEALNSVKKAIDLNLAGLNG